MTPAQARIYNEVCTAGERAYNGRAARPIRALAELGLVAFEFELVPNAMGLWTERYTVRPA